MTERNFDIEKIKAGARVVDRDGDEWRYIGSTHDDVYPHSFWKKDYGSETFTEDGKFFDGGDSDNDLTISTKRKAWIAYTLGGAVSNMYFDKEILVDLYSNKIADGWKLLEIEI